MNSKLTFSAHLFFFFVNATCLVEFLQDSATYFTVYRKLTFLTNYNQFWVVWVYLLLLIEDVKIVLKK